MKKVKFEIQKINKWQLMLVTSFTIFSCATVTKQRETFLPNLIVEQSFHPGYYVLVEQKGKRWVINKISERPIKRQKSSQEVLYISKDFKYVYPYFEKFDYDCDIIEYRKHKEFYTPCSSKLTKVKIMTSIGKNLFSIYTLGLTAGSSREVDKEKVLEVVKQTNMLEKVRKFAYQCEMLKEKVKEFKKKIIIKPKIIDKTGFYNGEMLLKKEIKLAKELKCPFDMREVEYQVNLYPVESGYIIDLDKTIFRLKYNETGYTLKPRVTLISKIATNILPKYTSEDENLKVVFDGKYLTFINKRKYYLQINSLSVYYDDKVGVFDFDKPILLSPLTKSEPLLIDNPRTRKLINISYYILTKKFAKLKNFKFGIAVRYFLSDKNQEKTLFSLKNYNLYEVLCENKEINCE